MTIKGSAKPCCRTPKSMSDAMQAQAPAPKPADMAHAVTALAAACDCTCMIFQAWRCFLVEKRLRTQAEQDARHYHMQ